mgnify:FL=1|tara:strand:- start:511 stop:1380 length:870 start_codon:yes stop_codon:yes gene_type:complete
MSFDVQPLDATFGAVVTGLKLAELDDAEFDALYQTWLEYALLVFPGQHLSNEDQVTFAKRFGTMEFDLSAITNVDKDGKVHHDRKEDWVKSIRGNMGWHTDSTYMPVQAKGAVFTAHVVPSIGGETGWADTQAAYEALDPALQARIADLSAYHSLWYSQSKLDHKPKVGAAYGFHDMDPPLRPLVKVHPETGRKCLTIGRHAHNIPGLTQAESDALLDDLVAFTVQAPRVYHLSWTPGDAVVWDNRRLMHQACPWDMHERRIMYHSRIAGDEASEFAGSDDAAPRYVSA